MMDHEINGMRGNVSLHDMMIIGAMGNLLLIVTHHPGELVSPLTVKKLTIKSVP